MTKAWRRKREVAQRQTAIRVAKARRGQIEELAASLAEIAPSTSRRGGFCVRMVGFDMALKGCWKEHSNEKADMAHLLENALKRPPRKPKALVPAVARGGVQSKARKGEHSAAEHPDAIAAPIEALGFGTRSEVRRIEVPEPSRRPHQSQDLVVIFDHLDLHEALKDDVAKMFREGHFKEAVRTALESFIETIQDALGDHMTFGRELMANAFGGDLPPIALSGPMTANKLSKHEGFKFLTLGAMPGMRNLCSHVGKGRLPT